ncbi:uncharacterized protein L201_005858 [Kwoniella dendrophila CBS 6074]|uniref:Alpha/beta hydrolase fold-3 domain-containing protein n=1 Tax=Kwoniella dendrophila CBS 6074 TaxID=1295534 RepID=A0AAX4K2D4_9TREE
MEIEVHPISERTWFMHLLLILLRPFKPNLVKPPSPTKLKSSLEFSINHSPKLQIPNSVKKKCVVSEKSINDIWCYDLCYRDSLRVKGDEIGNVEKKDRMLYFCGGGFQAPPSSQHWSFVIELARKLPHMNITVISYPLAPFTNASKAIPALVDLYKEISIESQRSDEDIHLGGDSSGGNIALSLTLQLLSISSMASDQVKEIKLPKSLILISPVVDCSNSNPEMREIDKLDPVLSVKYTGQVAEKWRGGDQVSGLDPLVSPLKCGQEVLLKLKENGIIVNGIVGTWDVLSLDTMKLIDRLKALNIKGSWYIGQGQMHCFPLAWRYGLGNSERAKDWVIDTIRKSSM